MSHVAHVELTIQNLDDLKLACQDLGVTFCEGQQTWKWYGRWVRDYHADDAAYRHGIKPENYGKSEHAIRVPGAEYEVGVCRNADGQLCLVYDNFSQGKGIEKVLGRGLPKLKQAYADRTVRRHAKQLVRKGYRIQRQVLADGRIQVVATR